MERKARPLRYKKNISAREKFKAYENVFDQATLRVLFKLSSQGYFDELQGAIKIGKEANVFFAIKGKKKVVVKIYRKSANFKKMYDYMAPDPRYIGLKRNKMNIISTWAKKEYRNLLKARSAGVKVPTPYAVYQNVLVMEFIGDKEPAPQLNKVKPDEPKQFYETLIKYLKKLYLNAKLVHADLSEFNILNDNGKPVIIDLSHAVDVRYPNVKALLKRDLDNLARFFKKLNVEEKEVKWIQKN
ncbi:serine protein kinase RIO [Candidatus Woesearchaeota archaeon]|nr:MAG: serine protein kinase RIO [Candidatus Woesearchaeota archaeon]